MVFGYFMLCLFFKFLNVMLGKYDCVGSIILYCIYVYLRLNLILLLNF